MSYKANDGHTYQQKETPAQYRARKARVFQNQQRGKTTLLRPEFAGLANANANVNELYQRALEKPVESPLADAYLLAPDTPGEVKSFHAGSTKGYQWGHETGFWKGVFAGAVVAVVAVGGGIALGTRNS